ncbi:MAG: hypothetical protein LJE69_14050 [Thiohalocapsa sp.]|jgi:hypothetical protein|uniref:hypothetical protein n=1 Tax=Thiohalocapsa sp. TaxID=2497641 RepID=UPI0025E1C412|nr:hypothetical protein [Thiohalocapsa sp.]MCG6942359.1 hypothetical protein [Thiohalocapsa sp.]
MPHAITSRPTGSHAPAHPRRTASIAAAALARTLPRLSLAAGALLLCLSLAGCAGGGIYANVGIAGPSVDLGPVKVHTGVNLGRWL